MIDQSSLSFKSIKEDLITYIESLPESNRWRDFYDSSVGTTLIDMLAGFAVFLSYKIYFTRNEVFLHSAQIRSSVLAIAETLGYSAFRGKNNHVSLTITPSQTKTIEKFEIVGTYGEYDLVSANSYSINSGVQTTIICIIGNHKTAELTVNTVDQVVHRFEVENISDDYIVKLNGSLLPTSEDYTKLLEDYYVVFSNYLNSIDLVYLNTGNYQYEVNDVLSVEYVEYEALDTIILSDLIFLYGTIDSSFISINEQSPESLDSIRINAPLNHETQKIVRGRNDYKKVIKLLIDNCLDTNAQDISPAILEVTYVRSLHTNLSSAEKTALLASLETYRPFGIPLPQISDPIEVSIDLDITMKILDPNVVESTITTDIDEVLSSYKDKLGITIDLSDIEHYINENSYVKTTRITTTDDLELAWNEYADITYTLTLT